MRVEAACCAIPLSVSFHHFEEPRLECFLNSDRKAGADEAETFFRFTERKPQRIYVRELAKEDCMEKANGDLAAFNSLELVGTNSHLLRGEATADHGFLPD